MVAGGWLERSGAATGESGSKHSAAGGQASTNQPSAPSSATAALLHLDLRNISAWLPSCFVRVRVGCSCKDLVSVFQGERQNHKNAEGRISDAIIVNQAWLVTAVFPCICFLPSNFKLPWTWFVRFSARKICFAHAKLFCDLKVLVDIKVVNVRCQVKEILVNL